MDCKSPKLGITTMRKMMPHHIPVPNLDFVTFCVTLPIPPLLPYLGRKGSRATCR